MHKITYGIEEEPIVISKITTDRILKEDNPIDLMAVYWFYYYTAKWQSGKFDTRLARATNSYVAKGLKTNDRKIMRSVKILIRLGLIERIKRTSENGRITDHLVKVNFMWSEDSSGTTLHKNDSVVKMHPNTEETNSLNTEETNSVLKKEKFDPEDLPLRLSKIPEIVSAWKEFVAHRKEMGHKMTKGAWNKLMSKMIKQEPKAIISAIDRAIEHDWRGLFFKGASSDERADELDVSSMTSFEIKLSSFLFSALGPHKGWTNLDVRRMMNDAIDFYKRLPNSSYDKSLGPKSKMSEAEFIDRWLEFLSEKQEKGFELQNINQLRTDKIRWSEFIRRCERYTNYDFLTGEYIG